MKKIIFILLAAFFAAGINAQVDLEVSSTKFFYYFDSNEQVARSLVIVIQNNGPDDYEGQFFVSVSGEGVFREVATQGKIRCGEIHEVVVGVPLSDSPISVHIDSRDYVVEANEGNNWWGFKGEEPLIRLLSGNLIARDLRDTTWLTPGEVYGESFAIMNRNLNGHNSMIGVDLEMTTHDLGDKDCYFSTAFTYVQNIQAGYKAAVKEEFYGSYKKLGVTLLANSSEMASDYHYLCSYWGLANYLKVGDIGRINIFVKVAQTDLNNSSQYASRILKVRDAIRGDINGDGVVTFEDFDLLKSVVSNNLYNPWEIMSGMYTKKGVNYGAGRVLFSSPDFLSVALLNIWLNNPKDPLVQGLGIGELMSTAMPGSSASSIKSIDNTFTVSENGKVVIDAPDADVYNVVAQDTDGRMIQRTGRIGEEISLPIDAKNVRVETVKIKNGTTGLFSATQTGPQISVYPNPVVDYLNINSPEDGQLSILNVNGQETYSQPINAQESLTLSTGDWGKGVYLIKIATGNGQSTVKVVK